MPIRFVLALPIAGAIVMFLFLLMAGAIRSEEVPVVGKVLPKPTIPEVPGDRPVKPTRLVPPEPSEPPPSPPPPEIPVEVPLYLPPSRGTFFVFDTEPTPIIVAYPHGFEQCLDDGGETHRVRLLFDINPAGRTANIDVINSTDDCFNRYAIRALRQWRYNPKVVLGEPVWQCGCQTTVIFGSE